MNLIESIIAMDILSNKIVKTRKKHNCSACGRGFEKGTQMRIQVDAFDGIGVWRECPTCTKLLSKYSSHFEDDYDNMYFRNCVNEVLEGGQTPEELLNVLAMNEA